MNRPTGGGKLPGKTKYSGRRRDSTRTSGFKVHADTTGGEFRRLHVTAYTLNSGEKVDVGFRLSGHAAGSLLGYGMWFRHTDSVNVAIDGSSSKRTLTHYANGSWNKIGSMWEAQSADPVEIVVTLTALATTEVAVYQPICGRVRHHHLDNAREALLSNMFQFAPEAIFLEDENDAEYWIETPLSAPVSDHLLIVKSCNRCGRYLPINVPVERNHLSFTNHCVAELKRPCQHGSFGRLRNVEDASDILRLEYGYQLECRFCKKFEVNAAHNPQRSTAQMKEDGARRRAFELLLAELLGGTPQLRYRHDHGSELAEDVWERSGRTCFNCGTDLPSSRAMHLDHTRPLALLWPLDGTATALCGPCNSEKRDRAPADFYPQEKLTELSRITGISLEELSSVRPNEQVLDLLLSRLEWFFGDFLAREDMLKERDGKIAGDLVVKALQKVISRSPSHHKINLRLEYDRFTARAQ